MCFSRLPQELVDNVIAEIHDHSTLLSCTLVSHSFLAPSRVHLFSVVRVTRGNTHRFLNLLSSCPHIAKYIQTLQIPFSKYPAQLSPETFEMLPNLINVSSHGDPFGWRGLYSTQRLCLSTAIRHLTSIEKGLHMPWCLPEWASLLNTCLELTDMTVSADSGAWQGADMSALKMPAPSDGHLQLKLLKISGDPKVITPLTDWLVPAGSVDSLRRLDIDVTYSAIDYDDVDRRPKLVQGAAAFLECLTLHLDPRELSILWHLYGILICFEALTLKSPFHNLTLTDFWRLRSLCLTEGVFAIFSESIAWLSELLATATDTCSLEEIRIHHSVQQKSVLDTRTSDWLIIDQNITSDNMPRFQNLTFKCHNNWHIFDEKFIIEFRDNLEHRLPSLHARGFLHVLGRGPFTV